MVALWVRDVWVADGAKVAIEMVVMRFACNERDCVVNTE